MAGQRDFDVAVIFDGQWRFGDGSDRRWKKSDIQHIEKENSNVRGKEKLLIMFPKKWGKDYIYSKQGGGPTTRAYVQLQVNQRAYQF